MDQREEGVTMSGLQGIRSVYATLGPVGALATVAGCLAVVVVGASLVTFTRGAITTAPDVDASAQTAGQGDDKTHEKYLAQINGRTLFYAPVRVAAAPPPPPEPPPGPPQPPPPPTEYGGSRIIAMVLDTVWFEDGRKMKVGDAEKDDTEVVSVNAPWDAKLKWKTVEFTVPLFGRDGVVLKKDGASKTASSSTPETPPPTTEPPKDAAPDSKTASTPPAKPEDKPPEKPADPPKPGGEKVAQGETPTTDKPAEPAKTQPPAQDAQPANGQPAPK